MAQLAAEEAKEGKMRGAGDFEAEEIEGKEERLIQEEGVIMRQEKESHIGKRNKSHAMKLRKMKADRELFSSKAIGASSLNENSSKDWRNISVILSSHEKSSEHLGNFQNWKELELRLKKQKTFDEENLCGIKQQEEYWQQILQRLIALVRVLSGQNLAFCEANEKLYSAGNRNFLKCIEYLALFDPVMKEHLRKISDHETHVHYPGKRLQNELIQILANAVKENILEAAHSAKYFSIILDFTQDASHVEQMTMIILFVDVAKSANVDNDEVLINKNWGGVVPLKEKTGAFMMESILQELEGTSFSENLRGQDYDNGSNMKDKTMVYKGE
ncbi:uncharacterized protein LOC109283921 [Alligator mississippiensis]|uniref:uncharacterized protein LOC109283921 n=1 Tax=Alligator mississippiensis TaxID=8496 RepID=UPI00090741D5|nr:uncharacterized protein LOC109283921 [Alligator mississippiensis]